MSTLRCSQPHTGLGAMGDTRLVVGWGMLYPCRPFPAGHRDRDTLAAVAVPNQGWVGRVCWVPSQCCTPACATPSTLAGSVGGCPSSNWTPSRQRTASWQGASMPSSCTPMSRRVLPSSSARSSPSTPGECPAQPGRARGPSLRLRPGQAGSSLPHRAPPDIISGTPGPTPAPGEGWDLLSSGPWDPSLFLERSGTPWVLQGRGGGQVWEVQQQRAPHGP